MSRILLATAPAALLVAFVVSTMSASAHTQGLTCRTVDGNTVCAGPGAVSCQTVNGKTICTQGAPAHANRRGCGEDHDEWVMQRQDDISADDPDAGVDSGDDEADDAPLSHLPGQLR